MQLCLWSTMFAKGPEGENGKLSAAAVRHAQRLFHNFCLHVKLKPSVTPKVRILKFFYYKQ